MGKFTVEQIIARREFREIVRVAARRAGIIETQRNQKPVATLTINIEWVKSRVWRSNPRATAQVRYVDGAHQTSGGYTASGCGYDKESTVVGAIFDDFLRYKLWERFPHGPNTSSSSGYVEPDGKTLPYGVSFCVRPDGYTSCSYGQGVGIDCYYRIASYIGGAFEHVACGKTFDVYKYIDGSLK